MLNPPRLYTPAHHFSGGAHGAQTLGRRVAKCDNTRVSLILSDPFMPNTAGLLYVPPFSWWSTTVNHFPGRHEDAVPPVPSVSNTVDRPCETPKAGHNDVGTKGKREKCFSHTLHVLEVYRSYFNIHITFINFSTT